MSQLSRAVPGLGGDEGGSRAEHLNPPSVSLPVKSLSETQQDAFEERAAIMEYEAGLSRGEAERRAWLIIMGAG
ncbi:MAG: hypothetical protein ACPGNV_07890 [Mangrovicoccus sp.]